MNTKAPTALERLLESERQHPLDSDPLGVEFQQYLGAIAEARGAGQVELADELQVRLDERSAAFNVYVDGLLDDPTAEAEVIREGSRDSSLTSLAGSLRARGSTEAEMLAHLRAANQERCRPPLDDREVRKIAKSVGRYERGESRWISTAAALPAQVERAAVSGEDFIFSESEEKPAVWGDGSRIAWASGEPFTLVAPQGAGKTTLTQQLILARIGVRAPGLLGMRVDDDGRQVLVIAADRPKQFRRSFQRMVTEADRDILRDRLIVWQGPLPFNVAEAPDRLAEWVHSQGDIGMVLIDSLKDIATDLTKDETGSRVNMAYQHVVASGVELGVNHHQRKAQQGGAKPKQLDDVYGSTWLTAGCGSVVLLWGEPGSTLVEVEHLKQPAEPIGPMTVRHDHHLGISTVELHVTALAILEDPFADWMSAPEVAKAMFGNSDPKMVEKARRELDRAVRQGLAEHDGGVAPNPKRYRCAYPDGGSK